MVLGYAFFGGTLGIFVLLFSILSATLTSRAEFYKQTAIRCKNMEDISNLLVCTGIYVVVSLVYNILLFLYGKKNLKKIEA